MHSFKRATEPEELKQFKTLRRKSKEELLKVAQQRNIEVSSDMTKSDILKKLFQHRGE